MKSFIQFIMEVREPLGGVLPVISKRQKRKLHGHIWHNADVVKTPFRKAGKPVLNIFPKYKVHHDVLVPKEKIRATQKFLDKNKLKWYQAKKKNRSGSPGEEIAMWKHRGNYFVMDGHHRTVARLLRGSNKIKATVYDLDD